MLIALYIMSSVGRTETLAEWLATPNSGARLKVFLSCCPQSHPPTSPHPALPYLKGFLNHTLPNMKVVQKDLNAIFYSYIFSQKELSKRAPHLTNAHAAYTAQMEDAQYRNIDTLIQNHKTLGDALTEISIQHQKIHHLTREGLRLRGNTFTYTPEVIVNSRKGILEAIDQKNVEKNIFYSYYKNMVIPFIRKNNFDVVGLSIFLTDQFVPTFLLASMIKSELPWVRIILGGNYISRFPDIFSQNDELNRKLFQFVDAVLLNNGEIPLKEVLEIVDKSEKHFSLDLKNVNQVIYLFNNEIVINNRKEVISNIHPNDLPRPDFEGIFLDLDGEKNVFWTPKPVISLYTQRGCPFVETGCEFCAIPSGNNVRGSVLARSPEKVGEDMAFFAEKYNTTYFSFGNETLGKFYMQRLCDELEKRKLEATIDGYPRTDSFYTNDRSIDVDFIKKIAKYFRFLQFGFESSDEDTLKSMGKNREDRDDSRLVEILFKNKIYPHAFLITGFPPGRDQVAGSKTSYNIYYVISGIASLRWLLKNAAYVATYKTTLLVLPRDSKMIQIRDKKPILSPKYEHEIVLGEPRDLEYNIPYELKNGSKKINKAFKDLFNHIETPYKTFTHYTIYHQRQFCWDEGMVWSQNRFGKEVDEFRKIEQEKCLHTIWSATVGPEYVNALQKLQKKNGLSKLKRQLLEQTIRKTREENPLARLFPNGITSLRELIELDTHPQKIQTQN